MISPSETRPSEPEFGSPIRDGLPNLTVGLRGILEYKIELIQKHLLPLETSLSTIILGFLYFFFFLRKIHDPGRGFFVYLFGVFCFYLFIV